MTKTVLTIAGSDTLAGGGLQSDLKTFENYQLFGLTAITCIAVEKDGHFEINDLPSELLRDQLQSIEKNVALNGVKVGLVHQLESLEIVKTFLRTFDGPIVLDPVMAFKETDDVYNGSYRAKLIELFPFASIVTPNLREAELLSQQAIRTLEDMKHAAKKILSLGAHSVVIKGGERFSGAFASDLFYDGNEFHSFTKLKLITPTINGAGCTLASAITANLVSGKPMIEAIENSKDYVYRGIKKGLPLKNGEGNVWFGERIETEVFT